MNGQQHGEILYHKYVKQVKLIKIYVKIIYKF